MPTRSRRIATGGSYLVALVLAVGISTAINAFTIAVLLDAILGETPGLSENATQILTGWGGGVIGVIGAVVGYQSGVATSAGVGSRAEITTIDTPTNDSLPGSGSRGG
jgi:hypothetical protein